MNIFTEDLLVLLEIEPKTLQGYKRGFYTQYGKKIYYPSKMNYWKVGRQHVYDLDEAVAFKKMIDENTKTKRRLNAHKARTATLQKNKSGIL